LFCEDDASGRDDDIHRLAPGIVDVNRLVGLSPEGAPFDFAVNLLNDAEFAGAFFSPDAGSFFPARPALGDQSRPASTFPVGRALGGGRCNTLAHRGSL
jgi:hypothetical protein